MYKYLLLIVVSFLFVGCTNAWVDIDYTNLYNKQYEKKDISLKLDTQFHQSNISNLIISNDKKEIITASNDKTIRVFDIKEGIEKRKILGEIGEIGVEGAIYSIALSKDDRYLFSAGYLSNEDEKIGLIRVYDFKSGKLLKTLSGHTNSIHKLKVTEDGKYLFSMSGEDYIIWDISTLEKIKRVEMGINFSTDGTMIKRGNDYLIYVYSGVKSSTPQFTSDIRINKLSEILKHSKYKSIDMHNYNSNAYLTATANYLIVSEPEKVLVYNHDLRLIKTIKTKYLHLNIIVSPNEELLVINTFDKDKNQYVHFVYNINKDFKELNSFRKHEDSTFRMTFIDNSKIITTENNLSNSLLIWNIETGKIISKIKSQNAGINGIKINKNDKTIAFLDKKGNIEKLFNLERKIFSFENLIKNDYIYVPLKSELSHKNEKDKLMVGKSFKKSPFNDKLYVIKDERLIMKIHRTFHSGREHEMGFFINNFIFAVSVRGDIDVIDFKGNHLATLDSSNKTRISNACSDGEFLYVLGRNGIINIWDLKDIKEGNTILLKPITSIFFDKNQEWVMWTPEGYFDSSENGYKYIGFHINQGYDKEAKWVGIEKLYDHFYRPDLVKLALQGEDIKPYTKGLSYLDVLKNPAPEIIITKVDNKTINSNAIAYNKDEINFEFDVSQVDNGGVGIIKIYQEGKLVKTIGAGKINRETANVVDDLETQKLTLKAQKSQEEYLSKLENSVTKSMNGTINDDELIKDVDITQTIDNSGIHKISLPLKAGENKIEIEAFNKSNTVASIREKFTVDAKIKNRKPTVYAIIAGVNEFEDNKRFSNLKYSENDAKAIGEILQTKVNEKVVSKLLLGKDFTKENLFKAINDIKSKAKLEDKLIFYVSTHGKVFKGDLHVVPQNNKYAKDFIKFEDMFKEIQSISALDQIFVIDACESGKAKDIVSSVYDSKASVLAKQSGVHVLLATARGTFAFEHPNPDIKHGVFTNNILDALNSKKTDENNDRKISIIELSKVLKNPEFTTEYQYPIIRNVGQDTKVRDLN